MAVLISQFLVRVVVGACVFASIGVRPVSAQSLALTPRVVQLPEGDGGISPKAWVFPGIPHDVLYHPPEGWRYRPGETELLLSPGPPQASVQISVVTLQTPIEFDESGIQKLIEETLKAVTPDAEAVEVVSDSARFGPKSDEYQDHEVIVKYILQGVQFRRAIFYMQKKPLLVRFMTTARDADFDAIRQELRSSLFTWQWEPTGTTR